MSVNLNNTLIESNPEYRFTGSPRPSRTNTAKTTTGGGERTNANEAATVAQTRFIAATNQSIWQREKREMPSSLSHLQRWVAKFIKRNGLLQQHQMVE